MNTPTRPATPADDLPIETVSLKAPRLPTFFAEPSTDEPEDTIPNNDPPDCEDECPACGALIDLDDSHDCPADEPDDSFLLDYTIDPVTGGVFDRIGRVR